MFYKRKSIKMLTMNSLGFSFPLHGICVIPPIKYRVKLNMWKYSDYELYSDLVLNRSKIDYKKTHFL